VKFSLIEISGVGFGWICLWSLKGLIVRLSYASVECVGLRVLLCRFGIDMQ